MDNAVAAEEAQRPPRAAIFGLSDGRPGRTCPAGPWFRSYDSRLTGESLGTAAGLLLAVARVAKDKGITSVQLAIAWVHAKATTALATTAAESQVAWRVVFVLPRVPHETETDSELEPEAHG
jgi:hypothetical protein